MITRLDRILLAAPDRREARETWQRLFGAEVVREDHVASLAAERTVLRVGASEIELLEPRGLGDVAEHVSRSRSPIFAVGLATSDLDGLRADLDARAVHHEVDGEQLRLRGEWIGIPGLRVVLGADEEREPAGLLSRVYEATHLMQDYTHAVDRLVKVFDLDPAHFVPIESEQFGYRGSLTLFRAGQLDRIEAITPSDRSNTMGRFFARQGPSVYMFYAECHDTGALRERLLEHAPADWTGPREGNAPDNLWVHPKALHGALLGVSRDTYAWTWSGAPERVAPARR
ncbi:MAG: hypothetical protein QNK03_05555 [Myxococcota bacterium]|nr:hypothetical protein [Myxococcota bacterium]